MAVNAVPDGFHTLTPYLLVADARAELAFLKAAFGATAVMVMPPGADADGATETIRHAALQIGTSKLMMATAMRHAVDAGRLAFLAGRIPRKRYASASSPTDGLVTSGPRQS